MSVVMGLETPNKRTLVIVLCISAGVALASLGEIALYVCSTELVLPLVDRSHSAWTGFICQALGIIFEAARLVAIQKLLHGLKMGQSARPGGKRNAHTSQTRSYRSTSSRRCVCSLCADQLNVKARTGLRLDQRRSRTDL